ncbi:Catabolite control protein A [Neolewinella maritima]|uniref:Catabolite control protein A n=1 Tax=Neolewinella maritima TaxID=1383882 RepID=A0ABN8F7H3_9BACT|nr:LacI family DNA-binding transcriptional regulator [Neolewinella maritima]CAH0999956.1 Catabolite control protein A [Neolewinella maritima]
MKKKAVTIYDIAQRLRLSPSTVSRGLRNDARINTNTKRLIADTAAQLNYQPNRVAAGLRGGSTKTIGLIVPRINRDFFANAISGIEQVARRHGFQLIITQSNERLAAERENVMALTAARVDGILASCSLETDTMDHFTVLQKRHFPLVFFDRVPDHFIGHRVVVDDEGLAYRAVQHLLEQGARKIAHLGGPDSVNIYANRYKGYVRALRENNLPLRPEYIDRNCLTEQQGYPATEKLLQLPDPPEAIFSASDWTALGIAKYCKDHGIAVPTDLAFMSFANEPFTSIIVPAISSIEQFSERMGAAAAELLFRQISNSEPLAPERVVIDGELILRESSHRQ